MQPVDGTESTPEPTTWKTVLGAALFALALVAIQKSTREFWWTALGWVAGVAAAGAAISVAGYALRRAYRWGVAVGFTIPILVIVILLLLILLKL